MELCISQSNGEEYHRHALSAFSGPNREWVKRHEILADTDPYAGSNLHNLHFFRACILSIDGKSRVNCRDIEEKT